MSLPTSHHQTARGNWDLARGPGASARLSQKETPGATAQKPLERDRRAGYDLLTVAVLLKSATDNSRLEMTDVKG